MSTELDALKKSADLISKSFDRRNLHIIVQAISYIEFIESELTALRSQFAELQRKLDEQAKQEPVAWLWQTVGNHRTILTDRKDIANDWPQDYVIPLYRLPPNIPSMIEQARAEEREACAKLADEYSCYLLAQDIRERGGD